MLVVTKNAHLDGADLIDLNAQYFVFDKHGEMIVIKRDQIISVSSPTGAMLEALGLSGEAGGSNNELKALEAILVHAETFLPGKYSIKDLKGNPGKIKALAQDLKKADMPEKEKKIIKEYFSDLKKALK